MCIISLCSSTLCNICHLGVCGNHPVPIPTPKYRMRLYHCVPYYTSRCFGDERYRYHTYGGLRRMIQYSSTRGTPSNDAQRTKSNVEIVFGAQTLRKMQYLYFSLFCERLYFKNNRHIGYGALCIIPWCSYRRAILDHATESSLCMIWVPFITKTPAGALRYAMVKSHEIQHIFRKYQLSSAQLSSAQLSSAQLSSAQLSSV